MRIAHFSDPHFCCFPRHLSALFDKRLLGFLNFLLRRRLQVRVERVAKAVAVLRTLAPDWVVCTGDVTSVGAPEEFRQAHAALAPLLGRFRGRTLYVPGNHDAYVANPRCRQALAEAFRRYNGERWTLADLPVRLEAGLIRFFLVNQAEPTGCLLSSGRLQDSAQETLKRWLQADREPGEQRIMVGHFPVRDATGRPLSQRRRLQGGEIITDALDRGELDIALCGHDHTPFARQEASGAWEICAGALTVHGKINVLDLEPIRGRVTQFWVDVDQDNAAAARALAAVPATPEMAGAMPACRARHAQPAAPCVGGDREGRY